MEKCVGTLDLPKWTSVPFWPLLVDIQGNFKDFIKNAFVLPFTGAVCRGKGNNGVFTKEQLSFRMIALQCDCTN